MDGGTRHSEMKTNSDKSDVVCRRLSNIALFWATFSLAISFACSPSYGEDFITCLRQRVRSFIQPTETAEAEPVAEVPVVTPRVAEPEAKWTGGDGFAAFVRTAAASGKLRIGEK